MCLVQAYKNLIKQYIIVTKKDHDKKSCDKKEEFVGQN